MHQAYNDTVLEADLIGAKTAIKDNPISYFFPCGLATEYAKEFMTRS
jgi:hypothetical protein